MNIERLPDPYLCCLHNKKECTIVLQLVFLGAIQKTKKRLTKDEKSNIKPGNIYIYNENETGIRRWTDDKEWTPSRIQDVFLLYREMNGEFLKKTYSVDLSDGKWHIVIYTLMEWEIEGLCCKYFNKNASIFGSRISNIKFPKSGIFLPTNIDVKPFKEKSKKKELIKQIKMIEYDNLNKKSKNSNNLLLNTKLDREIINKKKNYKYIENIIDEGESSNKDLSIEITDPFFKETKCKYDKDILIENIKETTCNYKDIKILNEDLFNKNNLYQINNEKYKKEEKEKLSYIIFDNNNLDAFNEFVERQIHKKQ